MRQLGGGRRVSGTLLVYPTTQVRPKIDNFSDLSSSFLSFRAILATFRGHLHLGKLPELDLFNPQVRF